MKMMVSAKRVVSVNCFWWLWVFPLVIFVGVLPRIRAGKISPDAATEIKRLRTDLLASYDRLQRPIKDPSQPIPVKVHFDVQHIVSLDEHFQILTVKGVLMLKWTDEHLTWNPSSYSEQKTVHFSNDEVWLPDINSFYNVKPQNLYTETHSMPVVVSSDGSMKWYPQTVFDVPCSAQYRHYPFDSHNCSITLTAWAKMGHEIVLEKMEMPSSEPKVVQGMEWLLTRVDHENTLVEKYQVQVHRVTVWLFLERTSRIYRYICVVPTLISMISILFGFWLLPNDTSRYLIGCTNIIVLSMLLQYLAATVPSGKEVPLLAQYCATCLSLSATFVFVTVIIGLLRECSGIPPNGLVRMAHFTLDRYFCIFMFSHVSSENRNEVADGSTSNSGPTMGATDEQKRRRDWYSVAMLVDRITFWCFSFIFVVLLSVLAAV